jgi:hypothetical protein
MALQTFSFKIDDALDPDVVAWLRGSENRSIDIRKALRHYLDLPPRNEEAPAAPPPIDTGLLAEMFKQAVVEGIAEAAGLMGKAVGQAVAKEMKKVTIPRNPSLNELDYEDDEEPATTADELAMQTADPDATLAATGCFLTTFG